jgi:hypothetical protein
MNERVYGVLSPIATWPAAALFFVAILICILGFQIEAGVLGPDNKIPDGRFWYTPAEIRDLFERLEEHGRNVYATTAMTLDVVFPLVYGGMFAALIGHVYRPRVARLVVCVPVLTVVADLVENSLLSYYAWNFDGKQWPLLIWGATTATALKSVLFGLSMILTAAGGLISLANQPVE